MPAVRRGVEGGVDREAAAQNGIEELSMAEPIPNPLQWASASRDDRGKKVRIYRAGFMGLRRWTDHPVPKEEWERIRCAGIPEQVSRPKRHFNWTALFLAALLIWMAVNNLRGGQTWVFWAIFVAAMAQLASLMLGRRNWVWHNWGHMVTAMLSHKRCAQCAYPIGDARAAEDGRVVCRECGAAWFAASVGRPMETMSISTTIEH